MGIKKFNPTSPGRRQMTILTNEDLTRKKPEKGLLTYIKSSGGRNNGGRISVRFRGGGHKRMYRHLDFKRDKPSVLARVAALEYDPNRSARLALLHYADGEKRYILAPVGLRVGDPVQSGPEAEVRTGNAFPLIIPTGAERASPDKAIPIRFRLGDKRRKATRPGGQSARESSSLPVARRTSCRRITCLVQSARAPMSNRGC